ncbi:MAG: hypothetical protein KDD60_06835, partial [Bdellovibrionales bacterium]|nr:hypothetical protein [Bdellovibrionales bacterium]
MSNDQRVHQTSKPGMAGPQISKNVSSACKTIDVALGKKEDVKTCRVVTGSLLGEGVEAVQEKYHEFWRRHIGPSVEQQMEMAQLLGFESLDALTDAALPNAIQLRADFRSEVFPHALSEQAALQRMKRLADSNVVQRSLIGMGYYGTYTPTVILRNILENPGWYTQYTPYQPEISQGRLEALLNYQTLVSDLTGLPIVNASLLDEGTAIAEAMTMCFGLRNKRGVEANVYFVAEDLHPQSIGVVATRAAAVGIEIEVGAVASFIPSEKYFGACFQYPNTEGGVYSLDDIVGRCKSHEVYTVVATDLLALVLLQSPGAFGVDVAVGSAQRFGVPLGFGGPHAAFMATRDEYKRSIPGRLVGVSKDSTGKRALRLSLQTREQHIRREKATSNICTAQVLLAIMAGMYAVYHGPQGLKQIALRIHGLASKLALGLVNAGCVLVSREFFDTITIRFSLPEQEQVRARAKRAGLLLRYFEDGRVGISLDECSTETEVEQLLQVCLGTDSFGGQDTELRATSGSLSFDKLSLSSNFCRTDEILRSAVFNLYHSETEFLRYVKRL